MWNMGYLLGAIGDKYGKIDWKLVKYNLDYSYKDFEVYSANQGSQMLVCFRVTWKAC